MCRAGWFGSFNWSINLFYCHLRFFVRAYVLILLLVPSKHSTKSQYRQQTGAYFVQNWLNGGIAFQVLCGFVEFLHTAMSQGQLALFFGEYRICTSFSLLLLCVAIH